MVKCSVCKERNKAIINTKCFHMICKECSEHNFKNRNRICPVCMKSIAQTDVHPIYWN